MKKSFIYHLFCDISTFTNLGVDITITNFFRFRKTMRRLRKKEQIMKEVNRNERTRLQQEDIWPTD